MRRHLEEIFAFIKGEKLPCFQMQSLMFKLLSEFLCEPEASLKSRLSTQSLRSGGATLVAMKGVSNRLFQRHVGGQQSD